MKFINALVQDITVATKGQFDISFVKSHSGAFVITLETMKEYSTLQVQKLVASKLANIGIAPCMYSISYKFNTVRTGKSTIKVSLTVDDAVIDKDVKRIPLAAKTPTIASSLKDYLLKYDVVPTDWKSNSTKGTVEVYGIKATKARSVVSMIQGYYNQLGLVKQFSINDGKEGLVNIRIRN